MKAVGYVRVSTDRQEISPDAQRHMLERWAELRGAELLEVHEDRWSGGLEDLRSELDEQTAVTRLELRQRPGLLAAIAQIRREAADCLVAVKRDRILRDVEGMRVLARLIQPARIVATSFEIDERSTFGRLATGVIDLMAESERHQVKDRTAASLAQLRREGRRTGELRLGETADADGKLAPNPDELAAIELMLELKRERGWGRRRIANELQRRHEASGKTAFKPRGARWQPGTVGRVLARERNKEQDA